MCNIHMSKEIQSHQTRKWMTRSLDLYLGDTSRRPGVQSVISGQGVVSFWGHVTETTLMQKSLNGGP